MPLEPHVLGSSVVASRNRKRSKNDVVDARWHHQAQTELLAAQTGCVDVMITHWPPTKAAIHPRFEGDELNPYFINDREDLVRAISAKLWVSGHTHEAYDYEVGPTRCIGNPTGYSGDYRQSRLFRPDKVVEIDP